jgi:hypothetical protein
MAGSSRLAEGSEITVLAELHFPGLGLTEIEVWVSWEEIMQLKIDSHTREGVTILECNDRIVFGDETAALREQVKNLVATGTKQIVINLGSISYIDSGGSCWKLIRPRDMQCPASRWPT